MSQRQQNRRRTRIVDPRAQLRMMRRSTLLPLVVLGVSAVVLTVLGRSVLTEAERSTAAVPSLVPLLLTGLTSLLSAVVVIIRQSFRFSHTVAGPAYRLRKSMQQLRSGDFTFRVRLRQGDELQDVADELNEVLEWLQQRSMPSDATSAPSAAPSATPTPTSTAATGQPGGGA